MVRNSGATPPLGTLIPSPRAYRSRSLRSKLLRRLKDSDDDDDDDDAVDDDNNGDTVRFINSSSTDIWGESLVYLPVSSPMAKG